VSDNDTSHLMGTTESWKRNGWKDESSGDGGENWRQWCGCDMTRLFVVYSGSGESEAWHRCKAITALSFLLAHEYYTILF